MYPAILSLLGLGVTLTILLLAGLALVLVFEVWMFIEAFTNQRISPDRKLLWLVGMLLVHPFVAIVYFFTDHRIQ